ncbi:ras-related C3 botulinum toxin substrate 3-like [Lycorma delicatula]|uniref:ras-related C3 botulinum toxin substrate 3-like n=1 Tax=Lycorma delicatula TaxID=130591 RepID=UPI003F50F65D
MEQNGNIIDLAIDSMSQKLFWTVGYSIKYINLENSMPPQAGIVLYKSESDMPCGLAVDICHRVVIKDKFENVCMIVWMSNLIKKLHLYLVVCEKHFLSLTNCFLLCFSVDNRSSYENVTTKWYPELKHHCPHTPIILVATKTDLRCASDSPMVTYSEGKKLQRKIKAVKYMECSALENNGLTEIFTESVRASIKKHPSKTRNCNVF